MVDTPEKFKNVQGTNNEASEVNIQLPDGVSIRTMRDSDAASMSRHGNNRAVWDNLRDRMPNPYTEEDAKKWIALNRQPSLMQRSGAWTPETGSQGPALQTCCAICVNDEQVGCVGLEFGEDVYFRTAEVGYWLGEQYWGKGIMSKVVPAFVAWTWDTFGILIRINAEAREGNLASRKLLQKAGLVEEGRKKNAFVKNGVIQNNVLYGMLRPGTE